MENSSFSARMMDYWDKAMNHSYRSADFKANIAHLYGVVSEFHYESIMFRQYDGPGSYGQTLSMDVEAKCLDVLNAFIVPKEKIMALENGVLTMEKWMKACENS